jgi:hypothetical protein
MFIPKRIKIGGFIYNVERPDESFISNFNILDGEHSFANHTITVAKVGSNEYQNVVFLHEICHAIIDHYVSPEKQDEHFVEQFSKGLYQVLMDNMFIFKEDVI